MPLHLSTPLLESTAFSRAAGRAVWLKLESVQPSGSFKMRGIGHACETRARAGARRFMSSSGGNAGLACAWAARRQGVPATVFLPATAPTVKVAPEPLTVPDTTTKVVEPGDGPTVKGDEIVSIKYVLLNGKDSSVLDSNYGKQDLGLSLDATDLLPGLKTAADSGLDIRI